MIRLSLCVDPSFRLELVRLWEDLAIVVVDEGAHTDGSTSWNLVVEALVLVHEVLVASYAREATGNPQSHTECFINDTMKVWVLFELDPAEIARVLVLELILQSGQFLGLREEEKCDGRQQSLPVVIRSVPSQVS
jgi:hypothetical protein